MPSKSGTSTRSTPDPLAIADVDAIVRGEHGDPFAVLGMFTHADALRVRAFLPGADEVGVIDARRGRVVATLDRIRDEGFFAGVVPRRRQPFDYRLRVRWGDRVAELDDPYRFGPILGETDLWLFNEGTHLRPYERLGAVAATVGEALGVSFAVWAPNARRVSVVGDFNDWDERRHPMRRRLPSGVWELFIPGIAPGSRYKYSLIGADGVRGPWRADPFARRTEHPPANASVVPAMPVLGAAATPDPYPRAPIAIDAPVSIYEVHPASWRRVVEEGDRPMNWDELGDRLIDYTLDMGFTHLELLPITEHPFGGSWGYQPTGLYAPTARHGSPEGFRHFITRCHEAGLGVLVDWVPAHFPSDTFALARFDGTHLYEHADPREGVHPDWDTLIYNYGRSEVANFLLGSARFWVEEFDIDGLRVDAVASMLYRDYSREAGRWLPNVHGGRENLEAIALLRRLNETMGASHPRTATIAEESTAWPGVSRPVSAGGLGFHFKWNMGWMNDTLRYMRRDPSHRRYHHDELTFGMIYAFDENFILPLSHDEVVHGKGSLIGRMPGDRWQKFANLRLYLSFMYAHPGKKLLFMGGEFAQIREWNHDRSLDWHLLGEDPHRGVQTLVRELNRQYRATPALHVLDAERGGFEWICSDDRERSVIAFLRRGREPGEELLAVCNFTPVPRQGYRVGVPHPGRWRECLNSDSGYYGGSNVGNDGEVTAEAVPAHGRPQSLALTLPPLATIWLRPAR